MRQHLGYRTVTILVVCLWTTARISLCGGYGVNDWDVTPNYSQGTPYNFTDDDREAIVNEHNRIRASVGARNMLELVGQCLLHNLCSWRCMLMGNSLIRCTRSYIESACCLNGMTGSLLNRYTDRPY